MLGLYVEKNNDCYVTITVDHGSTSTIKIPLGTFVLPLPFFEKRDVQLLYTVEIARQFAML